ncbi:Uncharacterized protein APZ42_010981 [Daphnia magna]|uniref:Tyr recombinase domain-containing protein n=1 Tax=Daphnia magna TaxID=35525 RepID=A0A162TD42_9CRUS|nr:Uncharacterized protein APZ42_010981 [Daphnia magna]
MTRRLKESAAHKPAEAAEKTWLSVQLKVLDIAGPLVYLHQLTKQGRPLDMEEVSENVKVALELTAAASYDINRRRRRNILNHTDPRSDYLLEDPKSFSSKQTVSSLFGKRFLEAMLKEADQDEKLSRRGPPGPAPKTAAGPPRFAGEDYAFFRQTGGVFRRTRGFFRPFQMAFELIFCRPFSILSPTDDSYVRGNGKEIYSDASLSGWGAVCDDVRTRGPWTAADRNRHINELEILAAFHAVKSFAGSSSKIAIKLYLDNSTAVCYINKGGGTRSIGLSILANLLNSFCEERSISLEAFFLPGKFNVEADEESRAASDSSDWMLCRRSFQAIDNIWATDVDLFSASWNHQHDRFISWRPQPGAWAVNAFSKNWGEFKAYAFPPFSMISRCLAKVKAEEARLLLICPVWPSQICPGRLPSTGREKSASSIRLDVIRTSLSDQGLPSKVVDLLLAGSRPATNTAYQAAWHSWSDWCAEQHTNPMSSTLSSVLSYLTHLFEMGKSYSTINLHRSMLSMTLGPIDHFQVGSHPLVVKLLRATYNLNPPKPKYSFTWDPNVVLDFAKADGENESLRLNRLSAKLTTLIALTSLLRVSEIAAIERSSVRFDDGAATLFLSKPRKSQHQGPLSSIKIPRCPDKIVCPVDCLGFYIYVTDPIRPAGNVDRLLISNIAPYRPVSASTVARWIKSYMERAGVDTQTFSAHSTRGAAASKAVASGVPIESVLTAAQWSRESTFARFYHRPIAPSEIAFQDNGSSEQL